MQRTKHPPRRKNTIHWPLGKALKGALSGLLLTIAGILLFAVLVKKFGWSDGIISAADQGIKALSMCVAARSAAKNAAQAKLPAGALAGALYVILGYLAFSLIQSSWGDGKLLLADLVMGIAIGLLTALVYCKLQNTPKTRKGSMK